MRVTLIPIAFVLTVLINMSTQNVSAAEQLVFISAFAAGDEGAIHAYQLSTETGELKLLHRTTDAEHPFFMALSKDRRFLYSIHAKAFSGADDEQVAAYALDGDAGQLKRLNRQSTRGTASCYLDVDATGKTVVVANYTTGSVASLPVAEDGSLGEVTSFFQHEGSSVDESRQKGPHAHAFVISPDNRFAFAPDLGLDRVMAYRLDPTTATLSPNRQPFARTTPGAGPRHLTFHPNGKHVYVINEMANSVTMFDYEVASGILIEQQTVSTVPDDFEGTSHCADLKITPDGRHLYGTNRGHDSIAAYSLDEAGRLTRTAIVPSHGQGPQNLAITAGGKWLLCANMPGNNVVVFRIDSTNGALDRVDQSVSIPTPSCIMLR